jgi:hypothetical protein
VSCSFLALVLKKALEDRIADLGKPRFKRGFPRPFNDLRIRTVEDQFDGE